AASNRTAGELRRSETAHPVLHILGNLCAQQRSDQQQDCGFDDLHPVILARLFALPVSFRLFFRVLPCSTNPPVSRYPGNLMERYNQLYIDGQWQAFAGGGSIDVQSASTEET